MTSAIVATTKTIAAWKKKKKKDRKPSGLLLRVPLDVIEPFNQLQGPLKVS